MKILWENVTEDKYNELVEIIKYDESIRENHFGSVNIGNVKVELMIEKGFSGNAMLIAEIYIGGVDDGYAYTNEGNQPYDFAGRHEVINKATIMLFHPFEKFKEKIIDGIIAYAMASDYCKNDLTIMDQMNSEELFSWE